MSGELLRAPLSEHLSERHVSVEEVVLVEYVERFPAPEPQDCLEHDDWVSATQCGGEWLVCALLLLIRGAVSISYRHSNCDFHLCRILSGSYDSTLHLWSQKGTHLLTIPGHTGAVKAVAWVDIGETTSSFVR